MAPKFKTLRRRRFEKLQAAGFLSWEARELSVLPSNVPALQALSAWREGYLHRFERRAARKGWSPEFARTEYRRLLKNYYRRHHWNVQSGPKKGLPNVWAAYRQYEKTNPPEGEYARLLKIKDAQQRRRNKKLHRREVLAGVPVIDLRQVLDLRARKQRRT